MRYLSLADDSVVVCHKILNVSDSVLAHVTNTVSANATSTMLRNSDNKNVRYKLDCWILHTFL